MDRIAVGFLTIIIALVLGYVVYRVSGGESACSKKGGVLIRTSAGEICIKEDSIIKE